MWDEMFHADGQTDMKLTDAFFLLNFTNAPKTNKTHIIRLKYHVLLQVVSHTYQVCRYVSEYNKKNKVKWSSKQEYKTVSDVWVAVDSAGGIGQAAVIVSSSNAPHGVANQVIKRCVCRNPSSKSEYTDFFRANNSQQIKIMKELVSLLFWEIKKKE